MNTIFKNIYPRQVWTNDQYCKCKQPVYNNSSDKNYVAKPGASEHQSGLVLDISTLNDGLTSSFKYNEEYKLISKYCMNYGFIIRYPIFGEKRTGIPYEPWHLRYVGEIAEDIYLSNLTLEEYLENNFTK